MKKTIFFAALACVALASCVSESENLPQENKGKLLTFSTPVMHNKTRNHVGEIANGSAYPESEHFVAYAVEYEGEFSGWAGNNVIKNADGSNFFPNTGERVSSIGNGHWAPSKDYYLPTEPNRYLAFAAYSPYRARENAVSISYGPSGLNIVKWTMPETKPYDLMFSNRTLNVTTAEVPIVFRHALSSLHFKFIKPSAAEGGPYQVLVTKLAIKGKGTTFINQATFTNNVAMGNMEGAPDWQSDKAAVNLPDEYVLFNGNFEVVDKASEITGVASFMPIPQNVTSDMKLIISYSIKQKESDATAQVVENLEIPFTSFLFTNTEGASAYIVSWDMNTRYFYNISFGALKKIYFHPSVSDWSTVDNAGTFVIE
jgi:hypothetical protein